MKKFWPVLLLIVGLIITGIYIYRVNSQPLAGGVLRLHVIANSDDPVDQAVKLKVKDRIVAMTRQDFKNLHDADEARQVALQEREKIKSVAESELEAQGADYPVQVLIGEYEFPTKSYGNLVFPQGRYQAVRVVLGQGQGKNWWCVLFPPLCMVSTSDRGLSLSSPSEAKVSLKCMELLPRGVKIKLSKDRRLSLSSPGKAKVSLKCLELLPRETKIKSSKPKMD